jgi:uncharacterized membrane protein YfcA
MTLPPLLCGSFVGFSLGLTGGGGSIFAVPLLVYVLGMGFRSSVVVSLAVVGTTALYGTLLQARKGNVVLGAGIVLGLGGIASSRLGSAIGSYLSEDLSLLLFAILMLFIGSRMIRGRGESNEIPLSWMSCPSGSDGHITFSFPCAFKLLVAGILAGILTGIFGIGGGFLLVPALLLVPRLSAPKASGTSLLAIALISGSAIASNLQSLEGVEIGIPTYFLAGALLGMTAGSHVKSLLTTHSLRLIFGWMVTATAIAILLSVATKAG